MNRMNYTNLTGNNFNKNITIWPIFYYSIVYQIIGTISSSIILIVGLIGNILVMLILILSKKLHTPTNCYLISLTASDILVLLSTTLLMLLEIYQPYDHWILGHLSCKLIVCLQYLSVDVSALSICAFSIERWVAICYPIRAHYMCTIRRAIKIIIGIWIFVLIYNLPWIFISTTTIRYTEFSHYQICTYKFNRNAYTTIYMCDLLFFYILPLIITSIMYIQISWHLFHNNIKNIGLIHNTNNTDLHKSNLNSKNLSHIIITESQQHIQLWKAFNRVKARKQVVKLLMVIVILFACFWLPYRFMVVYNSFASVMIHDLWFRMFARIMAYLNSAVNPILYNAMSRKFRRALKRTLKCQKGMFT